ncbi:hypothetical protein Pelo_15036 [Pelomyxa schiedti]|nr:hypothetical protein Pelo_15036 [Pelomyxa schiedti]
MEGVAWVPALKIKEWEPVSFLNAKQVKPQLPANGKGDGRSRKLRVAEPITVNFFDSQVCTRSTSKIPTQNADLPYQRTKKWSSLVPTSSGTQNFHLGSVWTVVGFWMVTCPVVLLFGILTTTNSLLEWSHVTSHFPFTLCLLQLEVHSSCILCPVTLSSNRCTLCDPLIFPTTK